MQAFLTHTRSSVGKPVSNNIIFLRETYKKILFSVLFLFVDLERSSEILLNTW